MAQDLRSAIRLAEKLASRGKLEAALRQYEKVLAAKPDDTRTLNRMGDLYARLNRLEHAIGIFTQAAERFVEEGFLVKAIAILKKIIRLDPRQIGIYERLADLYHRQGLRNEALSQYQVVADYYSQAQDSPKVLAIYEKMVELEPANLRHRVKLAEYYCGASKIPAALDQYQQIAGFMLDHGKVEDALKVYRGAFDLSPTDLGFLTDVVLHLKDSGRPETAEQLLAQAIARNPEAARVRQVTGLIEPGRSLPGDEGHPPPAASLPEEIPERPGAEATAEDAHISLEVPGVDLAAADSEIFPEGDRQEDESDAEGAQAVEDEEVVVLDLESDGDELPSAADSAAVVERASPSTDELEIDLDALEAGAALEAAAEAVEDIGDLPRPAEESAAADERMSVPADVDGLSRLEAEDSEKEGLEPSDGAVPGETPGVVPPVPLAPGVEQEVRQEPAASAETELSVDERLSEARMLLSYGLNQKAADLYLEILARVPDHIEAHDLLIDLRQDGGDVEAVIEAALRAREALGRDSPAWLEIEQRLEQWGFQVEAERISPPAAVEPAADVELPQVRVSVEEASEPVWLGTEDGESTDVEGEDQMFGSEDEFFDLAAELEKELRQDESLPDGDEEIVPQLEEQSLEEIVEGFKQGVAETLSDEDFETHYNLGIAYREMGLVDEAIGEFQLAAKSSEYLVDCCSLLGACFLEKGFPDLAIKWYERGLQAPQVSEMESLGLLYELGNLHLMTGEKEVARKTFAEIYGINSNYRDVVAKLEELRST